MIWKCDWRQPWRATSVAGFLWVALSCLSATSWGQLRITEVLFDTGSDQNVWEWFEVRNAGASDLDLDGYIFDDDDGDALTASNIVNTVSGGNAANTVVPAGRTAVLYNGGALGFDDQRFRDAWQLGASVPLIGVDTFSKLNNGGDEFGLWASMVNYNRDVMDEDEDGDDEVVQFSNATVSIDYDAVGFPSGNSSASIAWNEASPITAGTNWARTLVTDAGAVTSVRTFTSPIQINSTDDIANPGVVPAGTEASGLLITELMYDPQSVESDWEWIEVKNNTGATIDFSTTPHFLDDSGGTLAAANVTQGSIASGEIAILFNGDQITSQNMADAWGATINLVPVADWQQLNNDVPGDTIGLWDDSGAYTTDRTNGTFTGAVTSQAYEPTDAGDWPGDDDFSSIYLADLNADASDGGNWSLSALGDGLSFAAIEVIDSQIDHEGGDVGTPGRFGTDVPEIDGDFDDDNDFDLDDIDALVAEIVTGKTGGDPNVAAFDLTQDGFVNNDDLSRWLVDGGEANGFVGPFLRGDADLDGDVDAVDFGELGNSWQSTVAGWSLADFDADGDVDVNDFGELGNNWQKVVAMGAASAEAVPEPSSFTGWLLGIALLAVRRRR